MIKYQGTSLEFHDIGVGIDPVTFSIGQFKAEIKKIHEAAELAKTIDDYQYFMCTSMMQLDDNDPLRRTLFKLRIVVIHLLTELRAALIGFQNDAKKFKKSLYESIENLHVFLRKYLKRIMNDDDIVSNQLSPSNIQQAVKKVTKSVNLGKTLKPTKIRDRFTTEEINYKFSPAKYADKLTTHLKLNNKLVSEAIKESKLNENAIDYFTSLKNFTDSYRKIGYDVQIEKHLDKNLVPDLTIGKGNEFILFEIKKNSKKISNETIDQLTKYKSEFEKIKPNLKVKIGLISDGNYTPKIKQLAYFHDIKLLDIHNPKMKFPDL